MAVFIAMCWEMICGKLSVVPDIPQNHPDWFVSEVIL